MPSMCWFTSCGEPASIKQPLKLGNELFLQVPFCATHSTTWEHFADRQQKSRQRSRREQREDGWLLDTALALTLFPPGEPL
jgi:hypothetical protein